MQSIPEMRLGSDLPPRTACAAPLSCPHSRNHAVIPRSPGWKLSNTTRIATIRPPPPASLAMRSLRFLRVKRAWQWNGAVTPREVATAYNLPTRTETNTEGDVRVLVRFDS